MDNAAGKTQAEDGGKCDDLRKPVTKDEIVQALENAKRTIDSLEQTNRVLRAQMQVVYIFGGISNRPYHNGGVDVAGSDSWHLEAMLNHLKNGGVLIV